MPVPTTGPNPTPRAPAPRAAAPLPAHAQLSNINDMLVKDFNNDGNLDVIAVENLYVSEIETPRNDAGTGLYLEGDGKGAFNPVPSHKSGFFARKDAKKIGMLKNNGHGIIVVANNDDTVQFFKVK